MRSLSDGIRVQIGSSSPVSRQSVSTRVLGRASASASHSAAKAGAETGSQREEASSSSVVEARPVGRRRSRIKTSASSSKTWKARLEIRATLPEAALRMGASRPPQSASAAWAEGMRTAVSVSSVTARVTEPLQGQVQRSSSRSTAMPSARSVSMPRSSVPRARAASVWASIFSANAPKRASCMRVGSARRRLR